MSLITNSRLAAAIAALQKGGMIILTDAPNRENEGDLILGAQFATAENINFILRHSSGIICLSLPEEKIAQLQLPLMVPPSYNNSARQTPFTISVDAKENISTGVSAADRAQTIQTLIRPQATVEDLAMPGHIFPLQANPGGVLARAGHTEGALDILQLSNLMPAAVLCELMNPDGTMMRGQALEDFARQYALPVVSIEEIIAWRLQQESLIESIVKTTLPLWQYGNFDFYVIREKMTAKEHVLLHHPQIKSGQPPLVRIHSSCTTGDIFGSQRCDCHQQLHYALQRIAEEGGWLIYLNQEGRDIGLFNKIRAYALQDQGLDTVQANEALGLPVDNRHYYLAAHILKQHQISNIRLLTNNPQKMQELQQCGVAIIERVPLPLFENPHNANYLRTKREKLHHDFSGSVHLPK